MNRSTYVKGILLLLAATAAWGGLFPAAQHALSRVDAFDMTVIRYGATALVFIALLAASEGIAALRYDGKALPALVFGGLGFAGFSLFVFVGLTHTRAEHGAVLVALMPLLTALLNWLTRGARPSNVTLGAMAAALAGVTIVITGGHVSRLGAGGSLYGDALVLLGAASWVGYTLGASHFPGWSSLRYTALTCTAGFAVIAVAAACAHAVGYAHLPALRDLAAVGWSLAYITVFSSIAAVLAWNAGVRVLGALNALLFINFVPVTAFAIGIALGHRFAPAEFAGAALVIAGLVANNWHARRALAAPASGTAKGTRGLRYCEAPE